MHKKKYMAIFGTRLLFACLLAAICALFFTTCYLEGDINALRPTGSGTKDDPFYVSDVETLKKVGTGVDGWDMEEGTYYQQTADIYLSSEPNWDPIGKGNDFNASFNGKGLKISDLTINNSGVDAGAQGLFGSVGPDGEIENVNLVSVKIFGYNNNGSVAGNNFGSITNCSSTGDGYITGNEHLGGIAGANYGYVTKCYSTCIVEGADCVGGIAGQNDTLSGRGIVENCYSTGDITGTGNYTGGIVGYNSGSSGNAYVKYCYSTGFVEGNTCVGGVVGKNSSSCRVEKCVALGSRVSCRGGSIGRVIGDTAGGVSQYNYARSGMYVNGETKDDINYAIDGVNVNAVNPHGGYLAQSFWADGETVEWDFQDVWTMHPTTYLPILKGFPEGTQNPKIEDIDFTFPLKEIDTIRIYLDTQGLGDDEDFAINLEVEIYLGDMTEESSKWQLLLDVLSAAEKPVALNLSTCDMGEAGTFDPDIDISDGKEYIVELILPEAAINIPDGYTGIPTKSLFSGFNALKSVEGKNVTDIGKSAFANCEELETIDFPKVERIQIESFYACVKLKTINLPKAIDIGDKAFGECKALETIEFPARVDIGFDAFSGCSVLETINFPKVNKIGDNTFSQCSKLSAITMGSTAPELGATIFEGIINPQTVTINIPSGAAGYTPYPVGVSGADTTPNWANGFRGGGWSGGGFTVSATSINTNITVNFSIY